MICKDDISNIKNEICENIGRKVIIRGAMGRKKYFEEEAIKNGFENITLSDCPEKKLIVADTGTERSLEHNKQMYIAMHIITGKSKFAAVTLPIVDKGPFNRKSPVIA